MKNCFRIARQMAREGRDVISVCCIKKDVGNVVSDADGMKNLLNVENEWDGGVESTVYVAVSLTVDMLYSLLLLDQQIKISSELFWLMAVF